jgi:hypothetical protein
MIRIGWLRQEHRQNVIWRKSVLWNFLKRPVIASSILSYSTHDFSSIRNPLDGKTTNINHSLWIPPIRSEMCLSMEKRKLVSSFFLHKEMPPKMSPEPVLNELGYKEKLKLLMKKYGWFFIGTHFSIYFTVLGGIYLALNQGVDVIGLLRRLGVDRWVDISKFDSVASKLLLAFLLTKITSPIRIPITVTLTPLVARTFRRYMAQRNMDT